MIRLSEVYINYAVACLIIVTCIMFPPSLVHATSITINASCSLADAITAANTDTATGGCVGGSGADTITLSAAITLSARLPNIRSEIIIAGSGHSISGADELSHLLCHGRRQSHRQHLDLEKRKHE